MIAVDTNVIVPMILTTDATGLIRRLWTHESDWRTPRIWLYEFRNVIATRYRRGLISEQQCFETLISARRMVITSEFESSDDELLRTALRSGCTAYDCEYVVLARRLGSRLVTMDKQVLKAFPEVAISPEDFLRDKSRRFQSN